MKKIIILLIAITTSFATFAQKAKANSEANRGGTVLTTYSCSMHPDEVSDEPGKCSKCGMDLNLSPKEKMKADVMNLYTCPMHPDVTSNKAGKCSTCNMNLKVKVVKPNSYTCSTHPEVTSNKAGKCTKCGEDLSLSPKEKMKREVMKLYTCPMHTDVASDKPGKCSKCNMDLVKGKN